MDFALTQEQEALRQTARDYLARRFPLDRIAEWADASPAGAQPDEALPDAGPDQAWCGPAAWLELGSLGWLDDLGLVELALLAEQVGWALYPGPWLTTVALAAPAYRSGGEKLPGPATLAWAEPAPGPWRLAETGGGVTCRAEEGIAVRLTGRKTLVPDADQAAEVVVVASGHSGPALYAVAARHLSVATPSTVDPTRRPGELRLVNTPARLLVPAGVASEVLSAIRARALALFAAEAVGVAGRTLDMAVRHARSRVQFGRPIGANQAIAHLLADRYADVELARSLAYRAACCVDVNDDAATEAVAAATIAARHAALACCEACIQTLGAIGFSWEHPAHRWYRRARWLAGFEGYPSAFRTELAGLLLGHCASAVSVR